MIIDFSLILKSIPYVLSVCLIRWDFPLSFMVGNVFAIICLYADVAKALVEVSCPCLYFHHAWSPYVGRALHSLLWSALRWCSAARLLCAFIGFSCVSAAYMAEIFRSSIAAVDKGAVGSRSLSWSS